MSRLKKTQCTQRNVIILSQNDSHAPAIILFFFHGSFSEATVLYEGCVAGREEVKGRTRGGEEEEGGGSRFVVKSFSVGNYQSFRNAAAALTRQAAARPRRPRIAPTRITPSTDLVRTHTHTYRAFLVYLCHYLSWVYLYHRLYLRGLFPETVSFLQQTKEPHNASEGLCFCPEPFVTMLMCC